MLAGGGGGVGELLMGLFFEEETPFDGEEGVVSFFQTSCYGPCRAQDTIRFTLAGVKFWVFGNT